VTTAGALFSACLLGAIGAGLLAGCKTAARTAAPSPAPAAANPQLANSASPLPEIVIRQSWTEFYQPRQVRWESIRYSVVAPDATWGEAFSTGLAGSLPSLVVSETLLRAPAPTETKLRQLIIQKPPRYYVVAPDGSQRGVSRHEFFPEPRSLHLIDTDYVMPPIDSK
jgi:hypothetical protein